MAISLNILELELDFYLSVQREFVKSSGKLFMTSTLVVLKPPHMPLFVPSFVSLPKLKVLEIRRLMGLGDNNTRILLAGCATLE